MTLAPALMACSMVGMDAVIRASEVTLPSLTGTFRSARMKNAFALQVEIGHTEEFSHSGAP
jgi:hypothetical protein